ncbi:MAG: hypothetical protein NUV74_14735 [Candidatus Brocadiaceae bacterium]|nr:hypothetical protein [Candidatus Brocadiaceae bacterium]
MNKKQRESAGKYLYDISKGIALLSVIGNLLKEKWDIPVIIIGILTTISLFIWAQILEGGISNE